MIFIPQWGLGEK